MEKKFKPVPDVECLKYHGTKEKPDIKIFVSHRIDLDSVIIDNPLYIPVRCGATYDKRENVEMLGDDTGDNISEKRLSFCEFSVMYWAWKNVKADYYGLCHYRRYLSFLDKDMPGPSLRQGMFDSMSRTTLEKCGLLDETNIRRKIEKTDAIVPYYYYYYLDEIPDKSCKTIKDNWLKYHQSFLKKSDFDLMLRLIKEKAPKYYDAAIEFINGETFRGFNCFVMKSKLFCEMCEFMFPIMFEFDASIVKDHYSSTQKRAVGYLGEWLFSIFVYYLIKEKKYDVQEHQLLAFQNTQKAETISPAFNKNNIPIVMTATDVNRPMLGVEIKSILSYADEKKNYDFIILHRSYDEDKWGTHLRKQEDATLHKLVENIPNASLRFYDPREELQEIEFRKWGEQVQEELYYLLIAPWIFREYKKIIYLQDGMLAQADIRQLFEVDIDNYYAAATKNIYFAAMLNGYVKGFKRHCEKKLKLNDLYNYVSTDIILLNTDKIRKTYSIEKVLSRLKKEEFENVTSDGFNALFEQRIKFLPQSWNKIDIWGPDYFSVLEYFPEDEFKQQSNKGIFLNLRGISGQFLPQQAQSMKLFWSYARQTTFYEELLLSLVPNWGPSIFDLQWRLGYFDTRSAPRQYADKILPLGTIRRKVIDVLFPQDSKRRGFLKNIYYFFRPQYRPKKVKATEISKEDNTEDED